MEVKLKINNDTLIALGLWFTKVDRLEVRDGIAKVWVSIAYDLADRFNKAFKKIERQTAIFDDKKKHSYKLKYHEAWAFKEILIVLVPHVQLENALHYSLLTKVIHELDQKLLC
ncbi:hypothetical protein HX017_15380 [Myroides marinus]|uniref:hypothetical protein n=1 Tax=Myroides marinus TaxID=703342 RepID=UPI0025754B3F|nr:hypothetical protein [Myroides marinus]MDM1366322.1 hypothetical protein [Myroides marinus]